MHPFDSAFLQAALLIASPLLFVALGELLSETGGVINVGLEGMMLVGAFVGFWAGAESGNTWLAVLMGMVSGAVMAAIMGIATIEARANQIVVGVALNIVGAGVSVFAFHKYTDNRSNLFIDRMRPLDVPGLRSIPLVGPALFRQIPLVYISVVIVPVVWIAYYKTRWGLRLRAAGELPEADETVGVSVRSLRWQGVLIAGALAGLGGAFLSVGLVGTFLNGMTAGRGFLALAAVIVGGWRPLGVALAAMLFGAADALQLRLQAESFVPRSVWIAIAILVTAYLIHLHVRGTRLRANSAAPRRGLDVELVVGLVLVAGAIILAFAQPRVSLPSQLWLALPYVLTIAALAGLIVRVRQPSALAIPFVRGGGV